MLVLIFSASIISCGEDISNETLTDSTEDEDTTEIIVTEPDTTPPEISGVQDLSVFEGATVTYRQGVSAVDDRDGEVELEIDASDVMINTVGEYTVIYSATDSSGNTASVEATVKVNPVGMEVVYPIADNLLSQITKPTMTDREKARAIYDWCYKRIIYSSTAASLMGKYSEAALAGLSQRYGNCYTYYVVSSVLLTRVGIENKRIERNDPENPHYWNLVFIDGEWFHFDTCPQPDPHRFEVFLLTNDELSRFTVEGYYSFDKEKYPEVK